MDRMSETAGKLTEPVEREASRLKHLGLTANEVYTTITDAVEFVLNHLEGDLG